MALGIIIIIPRGLSLALFSLYALFRLDKLFIPVKSLSFNSIKMNTQQAGNEYEPTVPGFETPSSPEYTYNNVFYITEDEEKKGPPRLPPHLRKCALNQSRARDGEASSLSAPLPVPNPVVLNHMHTNADNRASPSEAVALATTQRFRSKYVTVVLYKPTTQR